MQDLLHRSILASCPLFVLLSLELFFGLSGRSAPDASVACVECAERQIAPAIGSAACFACGENAQASDDHTLCEPATLVAIPSLFACFCWVSD